MKKNILLIHPYFGKGGAEKGIEKLSKFLSKEGFLIYIFCLQIDSNQENKLRNFFFIKSPSKRIIFSLFNFLKLILTNKFEIIIPMQSPAISFYTPIIFLINLVKNKKTKIVSFERLSPKIFFNSGFLSILRKISYLLSLRLTDCLLTNSLEQLSYYKYQFPNKNSFYIPNSSSTNHLRNESIQRNNYENQNPIKILWIGRFEKIKDPFLAIETMQYLNKKFHLSFFGSGTMLNKINKEICSRKLSNRIRISTNNNELNLCEFDLVLHTSHFEGLPNTFIESLSKNIPIVTTFFTTGLCELFIPYWIYPCKRSAIDLAEKIREAISENDQNIRKGSNISQLILNHYSDENIFKNFRRALQNL